MKNFQNTLEEVSEIIQEYENSEPSINDLMLWKRLLFGKLYFLKSQEVEYKKLHDKTFLNSKGLKQENGKFYTDDTSKSYSNTQVPEYNLLHTLNKVIESTCISIQQDIKEYQQQEINSRFDGQT